MYKDKTIQNKIAVIEVQHVKPVQVASSKEFNENRVRIPSWDHPWRQARRLAIELAEQRHEAENGVTVLTVEGNNRDNPVIGAVI